LADCTHNPARNAQGAMKGWGKGVAVYQKGGDTWKTSDKQNCTVGRSKMPGFTASERFGKTWPAEKVKKDDNDRKVITADELFPAIQMDAETPMMKMYFTGEILAKYDPCTTAMERVVTTSGDDEDAWEDFEESFESFLNMSALGNWDGTKYDIIVYGCSGYTGYLMMEYLKRIALKKNPEEFTFAMAGRTRSKVEAMRDKEFKGTKYEDVPILAAGYDDPLAIIDMVKSAHVIVNVAGPYLLTMGEVMTDACCWCGTDYDDVSGEIPWSLRNIALDEHAQKGGAKIVCSAAMAGGMPDVWTFMLAKKIREEYGEELRRSRAYFVGGGIGAGSSGGTLASRAAMSGADDSVRKAMADPFALGGYIPEIDRNGHKACTIKNGTGQVTLKLRKEEADAQMSKVSQCEYTGVWRAPNPYAFFDTRIVRRSNALLADKMNQPYGKALNFQLFSAMIETEKMRRDAQKMAEEAEKRRQEQGDNPALQPQGGAMTVEQEKEFLKAQGKYYAQGEGPPLEDLGDTWVGIMMYAQSTSGQEARLAFAGGDGYFETARVAIETAMTLRFDREHLPIKGGTMNAAVAGQTWLAQRLINSGITFTADRWLEEEKGEMEPPAGVMGN